jgi:hypothetical protein
VLAFFDNDHDTMANPPSACVINQDMTLLSGEQIKPSLCHKPHKDRNLPKKISTVHSRRQSGGEKPNPQNIKRNVDRTLKVHI